MSRRAFESEEAKAGATAAIQAVEAQCAAEVVISLCPQADAYREGAQRVGLLLAFAALIALLYLPQPFPLWSFPLDLGLAFALGAWLGGRSPALLRLLTSEARRAAATAGAARAAFVDLEIADTSRRQGILIFVSLLEGRVEILSDVGVPSKALGPAWERACADIQGGLTQPGGIDPFLAAVTALGPLLAPHLPRDADTVSELSDEVHAR